MKASILITDPTAAGLFPLPADTKELHRNVLWYWRSVHRIGEKHKRYRPCDKTGPEYCSSYLQPSSVAHVSSTNCYYDGCFGDFGIKNAAEVMLRQSVHKDVFAHMQTVSRP
jgi:hypothetical protein